MVALLSLAWAQEIACLFMLIFHIRSEAAMAPAAKFIAVFAAYTLNIAMQPLNISLRALLMDICPPRQQATASLWIMRLSATGSVLVTSIAFFSSPSFKLLSVVCCTALFLLLALHTLEARYYYSTEERQSWKLEKGTIRSYVSRVRQLGIKATHMPNITHRVCRTQLFSWFGWFPALFYMGRYVRISFPLRLHSVS
jgi:solute carrier family 45 protein 1/2/4